MKKITLLMLSIGLALSTFSQIKKTLSQKQDIEMKAVHDATFMSIKIFSFISVVAGLIIRKRFLENKKSKQKISFLIDRYTDVIEQGYASFNAIYASSFVTSLSRPDWVKKEIEIYYNHGVQLLENAENLLSRVIAEKNDIKRALGFLLKVKNVIDGSVICLKCAKNVSNKIEYFETLSEKHFTMMQQKFVEYRNKLNTLSLEKYRFSQEHKQCEVYEKTVEVLGQLMVQKKDPQYVNEQSLLLEASISYGLYQIQEVVNRRHYLDNAIVSIESDIAVLYDKALEVLRSSASYKDRYPESVYHDAVFVLDRKLLELSPKRIASCMHYFSRCNDMKLQEFTYAQRLYQTLLTKKEVIEKLCVALQDIDEVQEKAKQNFVIKVAIVLFSLNQLLVTTKHPYATKEVIKKSGEYKQLFDRIYFEHKKMLVDWVLLFKKLNQLAVDIENLKKAEQQYVMETVADSKTPIMVDANVSALALFPDPDSYVSPFDV